MSVRIKTVLIWGVLILVVQQVLGYLLGNIFGSGSSIVMVGNVLALVVAAILAYVSAKSVLEGLLEGVVALVPVILLSGGMQFTTNSYLTMLLLIVGGSVGGYLGSKRK